MDLNVATAQSILSRIKREPLELKNWRDLTMLCFDQRDGESFTTFQAIIDSIQQFNEINRKKRDDGADELQFSAVQKGTFVKLAQDPNNDEMLRKTSLEFLSLHLPAAAKRLVDRALQLNPYDEELNKLKNECESLLKSDPKKSSRSPTDPIEPLIDRNQKIKQAQTQTIKKVGRETSKLTQQIFIKNVRSGLVRESRKKLVDQSTRTAPKPLPIAEEDPTKTFTEYQPPPIFKDIRLEDPISAEEWFEKANEFYNKGDFPNAIKAFETTVATDKNFFNGWFGLAVIYHETGELDKSLYSYQQALAIKTDDAGIHSNMGALYLDLGQYIKSVESCKKAVELRPDYARAWENLGVALSCLELYDESIQAFQHCLKFRPDHDETLFKLAAVYFQSNDFVKADEFFEKVVDINDKHFYAWCYLAMTQSKLGECEVAEEICKNIARKQGNFELLWSAWNEVGLGYSSRHDYLKSVDAYLQVVDLKPDIPEVWFNLGVAMEKSSQTDAAIRSYQQAVKLNPDLIPAWQSLGMVHYQQKNLDASVEAYRQVVKLKPDDHSAWYDLGVMLEKNGNSKEAASSYFEALKIEPDFVLAWNNVGLIHLQNANYSDAATVFQKVVKLKPHYANAWYNLGVVFHHLNEVQEAILCIEECVKLKPLFAEAWEYLSNLCYHAGQMEKAQKALLEIQRIHEEQINRHPA